MANKPPEIRREREKLLYFNDDRIKTFNRIKGRTILIPRVDPEGNAYKEAVTIPETLQEVSYLGFDFLAELVQGQIEEEQNG